jgi:hypothetical protein
MVSGSVVTLVLPFTDGTTRKLESVIVPATAGATRSSR